MRADVTKEAMASEALYDYFKAAPNSTVHSWHPPDSKAYFTRLLYIPKDGRRYHIDLIVQTGKTLHLIEVKDCLSNSYDDVTKLQSILNTFSTRSLVRQFQKQGLIFPVVPERCDIVIAAKEPDSLFIATHTGLAILLAEKGRVEACNELGESLLLEAGLLCEK